MTIFDLWLWQQVYGEFALWYVSNSEAEKKVKTVSVSYFLLSFLSFIGAIRL